MQSFATTLYFYVENFLKSDSQVFEIVYRLVHDYDLVAVSWVGDS